MNTIKASKILLIIVAILLITIPFVVFSQTKTEADSTTQAISSQDGDYIFFIVEEGKTPLAAAPQVEHSNSVIWFVFITMLSVAGLIYVFWYMALIHNTNAFINSIPAYLRPSNVYKGSILHPIRTMEISNDMVNTLVDKFFKN